MVTSKNCAAALPWARTDTKTDTSAVVEFPNSEAVWWKLFC
jgi:hypothetical protein